jgi:hypothetical protein
MLVVYFKTKRYQKVSNVYFFSRRYTWRLAVAQYITKGASTREKVRLAKHLVSQAQKEGGLEDVTAELVKESNVTTDLKRGFRKSLKHSSKKKQNEEFELTVNKSLKKYDQVKIKHISSDDFQITEKVGKRGRSINNDSTMDYIKWGRKVVLGGLSILASWGGVDFLKVKKIKKRSQSQDDNSDDMDD